MSDKRLSQYANDHDIPYMTAYRRFQSGEIQGAYKNNKGSIFVKEPDVQQQVTLNHTPVVATVPVQSIPDIKYQNISLAEDITTRKNRSADNPIINRFSNIDEGLMPHVANTSGAGNKSGIIVRDAIILTQKCYFNVAIFRQIIDLIVDLSIGQIFLKGGTKKARDFFSAYLKHIEENSFQEQWFLELWRSSNVLTFAYNKSLKSEDIKRITSVYGLQTSEASQTEAAKRVTIPVRFTVLNPADIQVGNYSMFMSPVYYKILNGYELARLREPKNEIDKQVLESLPENVKKQIKDKVSQSITIPLPTENVLSCFYKKMDYEGLAVPVFFPVLDDINWKLQLKKMDIATTRMMNQAILLVTTGAEPDKGGINQNNITNLQTIFANESVGRVLIADYTTKASFIIPDISAVLSKDKYEVVNNDIYIGLNYILLQGEKFANKQTALQLFIEKIKYGRKLYINQFLSKVIEKVSEELGFKSYPEAYFEDVAIHDTTERNRILARLSEIGHLTPKETFEALQNGRLPLPDESVENQEELKGYRDRGLYKPVTGGPKDQMDMLKEKSKIDIQMLDKQNEHDDKQKSKDRKFAKDNPQAPAPQIVVKAPTALSKPGGRPSGSTRQQSTKRVKPSKASLISGTKVIENTLLFDKLNKEVISALQTKYNLKSLDESQLSLAGELSNMIARNEDPKDWISSINDYSNNLQDKHLDRIEEIEELAEYHQIEPNLASILYASIKEETDNTDKIISKDLLKEEEKI